MQGLRQAKEKILASRTIVISGHINPDGDCIGSVLSLGLALKKIGKRVYMISRDGVPEKYRNLPGARSILKTTAIKADLAIAVDCSAKEMLGETLEIFQDAKSILEIDHHEFKKPFGDVIVLDIHAAAVGELVYLLLKELKITITKEIAQNILTSLVVETNSFRLPNSRAFTFKVCADLIDKGVNLYKLSEMVYWTRTKESALLSGIVMGRCKFIQGGRIAWSLVKRSDFKKIKAAQEAIDSVADELRAIKDVRVAVLFKEENKKLFRVSLRSKGAINVGRLAQSYGGGGHYDLAGCCIPHGNNSLKNLLNAVKMLLK
jgi:phosphoesterase RecJ-like protein